MSKKITEYSQITKLDNNHVFLVDGNAGTKTILAADAILEMLSLISPQVHQAIFRGKSLGSSLTDAQKTAIQDGSFDDIFLGDYWTINGTIYRVADFDYWLRCGDVDFTRHHLVIVPDTNMYTHVMNDTNTTEGGYAGSKMYTEGLTEAKSRINAAFGDAVLTHREYLVDAVTNGKPSGGAWFDSTVELMNENMMYGCKIFGAVSDGSTVPNNYTIDKSQLALFRAVPRFAHNHQWSWLRDVVSGSLFACVRNFGSSNYYGASYAGGVRPVFAIG